MIRFQAGVAENTKQLADRERLHVRRIAQFFPAVLISGPPEMFAAVDVLDENRAAEAANTSHFSNNLRGILHMVQRQPANHDIKFFLSVYTLEC